MSHVPTAEGQAHSDPGISLVNGIFQCVQGARSPAIHPDPSDSDDCMDLPTYVSLMAEQSKTSTGIRSTQSLVRTEDVAEPSPAATKPLKGREEKQGRDEESCNPDPRYIADKPRDVDPCREEAVPVLSSILNPLIESPVCDAAENTIGPSDASHDSDATEGGNNEEESDIAMPLNHSMDDEIEDVPLIAAYAHPGVPPFPSDLRKEVTQRGGLAGSKIMKRSSSVISDSGIESEPSSSVAWPPEAALRRRPPLGFSSELEIPKQTVCRHRVHRCSLEGLQMESNGSGGIQASLTSISSLPYEEDKQQRRLSKLTKSVSAPQISSPEDTEEDRVLVDQETDTEGSAQRQDALKIDGSSLNGNLDSERSESSSSDPTSTPNPGRILNENISSEKSNPSKTHRTKSALSDVSEVLLLQESVASLHAKGSAVVVSRGENTNHQTHIGGASASEEEGVRLDETEAVPRSCGNKPCVHKSAEAQDRMNSVDDCRRFRQTERFSVEDQKCPDPCRSPPGLQHTSTIAQRPSDLAGLITNDAGPPVDLNGISAGEKEPLDGQTKPPKIPNSGLAFVNKKMVEVVNMSVSCAPTCLPFSSALRDSPSISGMSAHQATSPITHQPLGSFGIISSSSLNPLNMDDETNERMLK